MRENGENMQRLRELSQIICDTPKQDEFNQLINDITITLSKTKEGILNSKTLTNKVKCYEEFYDKITSILLNNLL